jgi:hypothetical protein
MLKKLLMMAALLGAATVFNACSDDEGDSGANLEEGKNSTAEYNMGQSELDQVASYADDALKMVAKDGRSMGKTFCASYAHSKETKTIVLDFGTAGCTGSDGKTRKGKITVVYIGTLDQTGTNERTVTFNNYTVDGNVLNGTLAATRYTLVSGTTSLQSTLTATSMTLKFAEDNTTLSWAGTWVRTLNVNTDDFAQSSYTITGSSTGTTREGKAFTSIITSALTYKLGCLQSKIPYPVAGKQSITLAQTMPIKVDIDYGSGDCDKVVTVTVGKSSTSYTLP